MATETASLIIGVDSTSAKKATEDLDKLTKQGKETERATEKLNEKLRDSKGRFIGAGDGAKKATEDLNKFGQRAKSTEGAVLGLGKAFLALGGAYAIGAGIRKIINATIESEKAQAQLAAALKSTGRSAQISQAQLNAYAAEMQRLTVFDDEAVAGAQSLLLTFEHLGVDMLPRVTRATADVAQALGKDLAGAAEAVGKALDSPLDASRALLGLNVRLTDSQEALIKRFMEAGDEAKAQGVILEELERRYEGSAEAAKNTLGGALQGLKHDFDNLLEGEGGTIQGATDAINGLAGTMRSQEVKDGFAVIISGLASIIELSAKAASGIGNAGSWVKHFAESFADISPDDRNRINMRIAELDANAADRAKHGRFVDPKAIAAQVAERAKLQKMLDALLAAERMAAPRGGRATNFFPANGTEVIFGDGVTPRATGGGGRDNSAAEKLRAQAEAARDFASVTGALNSLLDDQARATGGPLLDAAMEYRDTMTELAEWESELIRLGKLDAEQAGKIAFARENTTKKYEAQAVAVANLTEKNIGLKDSEKWLTDAQLESIDFADGMRESLSDSIMMAFKDGDVLGAIDNFIGSIASALQRRLADSIADSLLGAPGTSGGGGLFGSVLGGLGSLFGGGGGISNLSSLASVTKSFSKFATGTDYAPGGMAWVGERGPELVNLPRGSQVIPADKSARMGGNTITINIAGHATKETAQQVASKVAQQMAFAGRAR